MFLNKVMLIGRVGKDPVVRYFEQNNGVANFTLATTKRGYRAQNGTEIPERTEWHNIVVRNSQQLSFVEKWVKKGSYIFVEGELRTRSYEKDGQNHYMTEIYVDKIEFFGGKSSSDTSANSSAPKNFEQPAAPAQPAPAAPSAPASAPEPEIQAETSVQAPDDDLPF